MKEEERGGTARMPGPPEVEARKAKARIDIQVPPNISPDSGGGFDAPSANRSMLHLHK